MNFIKNILSPVLALSAGILIYGCGGLGQDKEVKMANPENLEGSWRLIRTIEHGADDSTNRRDGSQVIYQKHITPTHFMWIAYDIGEKKLLGTGGGTYTYDGSEYVEDIHFFYPPGSNERGQQIRFNVDFSDGSWRHTGYVKVYDFDPESGDNLVSDSIIIDEIWEPMEAGANADLKLIGTWELLSYKEVTDSVYSEYPGFVAYYKHVTPTHFSWVHFNRDGDEVLAAGAGPYSLVGEDYTEFLKMVHPSDAMLNATFPFKATIEDGKWIHKGVIFNTSEDGTVDTISVDEKWRTFSSQAL